MHPVAADPHPRHLDGRDHGHRAHEVSVPARVSEGSRARDEDAAMVADGVDDPGAGSRGRETKSPWGRTRTRTRTGRTGCECRRGRE